MGGECEASHLNAEYDSEKAEERDWNCPPSPLKKLATWPERQGTFVI
jgi:hypothetical protein